MSNQEILGGLKYAISKGESLEKAMLSFYNAGYAKEEIEEAARFIQQEKYPVSVSKETKLIPAVQNPQSKISSYNVKNQQNPVKKAGKWLLIAIIVVAIIFVGLLIAFLVTT